MSTKGIGRQLQVAISKESSRGTANTTTNLFWLAYSESGIDEKYSNAVDEEVYGIIEDSTGQTRVKNWAEGPIKAPIGNSSFGLVMLALLGTDNVSTHAGESIVYDHVFTVAQNAQHQSLTINLHDILAAKDYAHANAVLHKLDIEYALDKFVSFSVDVKALAGALQPTYTPPAVSAILETRFVPQYLTFKSAATVSALNAASAIKLKSLKLSINENIEDDAVLGSVAPRDFLNKSFSVDGQLEAIWNGEGDFKTNALANTPQALRLDLVNSDVTIGSTTNPRFVIDLARCVFTEFGLPRKSKDLVYQTVKFKAHYDSSTSQMIKGTLTNLVASY